MDRFVRILTFVAALALFVIAVSVFEYLGPLVLGIDGPDPARLQDAAYLEDFMSRQPAAAFVMIALAHFAAAVVGGLVLGLGRLPRWSAWLLGGLCTAAGVANLLLVPGQPAWFWVLDVLVYVPGVLVGYRWVERTRTLVAERAS